MRSRPPSIVKTSRILGDVDVKYVNWHRLLSKANVELVSRAGVSVILQVVTRPKKHDGGAVAARSATNPTNAGSAGNPTNATNPWSARSTTRPVKPTSPMRAIRAAGAGRTTSPSGAGNADYSPRRSYIIWVMLMTARLDGGRV
jgi:hypothetical protein